MQQVNRQRKPLTVSEVVDQFGEPSATAIIRNCLETNTFDFDVIASRWHPVYREFTLVLEVEIDPCPVIYL
jgi:hypothetical protein